jgi:hypothetical protein
MLRTPDLVVTRAKPLPLMLLCIALSRFLASSLVSWRMPAMPRRAGNAMSHHLLTIPVGRKPSNHGSWSHARSSGAGLSASLLIRPLTDRCPPTLSADASTTYVHTTWRRPASTRPAACVATERGTWPRRVSAPGPLRQRGRRCVHNGPQWWCSTCASGT